MTDEVAQLTHGGVVHLFRYINVDIDVGEEERRGCVLCGEKRVDGRRSELMVMRSIRFVSGCRPIPRYLRS